MIDINELRRLVQAATPGPWHYETDGLAANDMRHAVWAESTDLWIAATYRSGTRPNEESEEADKEAATNAMLIAAASPAAISELLDRLEAAERELETERMRLAACGVAALGYFEGCAKKYTSASLDDVLNLRKRLEASELERDALRAKVEAMERQKPLITVLREPDYWSNGHFHKGTKPYISLKQLSKLKIGDNLYALPGAKGE